MSVYWSLEVGGSSVLHQRLTLKTRYGGKQHMLQRRAALKQLSSAHIHNAYSTSISLPITGLFKGCIAW